MFFIKFFLVVYLFNEVQSLQETLVLVHVIVRHGERTPDEKELYARSPNYNESYFHPYGYGQLTNRGKKTSYDVGTALRERYKDFLESSYHYTLVEGRSTDYQRTKETLQLILAGLFPPTQELVWLKGMNWTPIATHYEKRKEDEVLYPLGNAQFVEELEKHQKDGFQAFVNNYTKEMDYIAAQIREEVSFERMAYLTRGVEILTALGYMVPEWWKTIYPVPLEETMSQYFYSTVSSKQLKRFYGGYLLRKIIQDTELKLNGSLDPVNRKMFIYSGHDFNIMILLLIFDHSTNNMPPLSSYLILEVHKMNETYALKLLYNNYTSSEPYVLKLPGFGEFAPLEEFKIQYRDFIELEDLHDSSFSTRLLGNLPLVLLCIYTFLRM